MVPALALADHPEGGGHRADEHQDDAAMIAGIMMTAVLRSGL